MEGEEMLSRQKHSPSDQDTKVGRGTAKTQEKNDTFKMITQNTKTLTASI